MRSFLRRFKRSGSPDRDTAEWATCGLFDPDPRERVLVWPAERGAWAEENHAAGPLLAQAVRGALCDRHALGAIITVAETAQGTLVTGPVSSILLRSGGEVEAFAAYLDGCSG